MQFYPVKRVMLPLVDPEVPLLNNDLGNHWEVVFGQVVFLSSCRDRLRQNLFHDFRFSYIRHRVGRTRPSQLHYSTQVRVCQ